MKKVLKIVFTAAGILLLVVAVLAAFTQTQFFRDRLRAAALDNLGSLLDADVRMGEVRGNLITGFSVDSLGVSYRGVDVISVKEIHLRYNLLEIPGRKISVSSLILDRPVIQLLRSRDSIWNISGMIRPTPPDTIPSGPFTWAIILKKLEIRDGVVVVVDSTVLAENPPPDVARKNRNNFILRGFALNASGRLSSQEKHLRIDELSFLCGAPDIHLKKLSGEFTVTPSEASVKNLTIVTGRSDLKLNASLRDADILGKMTLADLRRSPVAVELQAHDINLNELNSILPALEFLNGPATLDLMASGEFGDLNVQRLDIRAGRNRLFLKGELWNLNAPRELTMNVKITESKIQPADLRTLMPPFDLPEFPSLGQATLNLEFEGRPLDFKTKFLLETSAGNVRTEGSLKIGGPSTLRYKGDILLQNVNLAGVLDETTLESKLNGTVSVDGEGVALRTMRGRLDARLDQSEFRGLPLVVTDLSIDAERRKVMGKADVELGAMRSVLTASVDEQEPGNPAFAVEGKVNALNLAPLLHDNAFDSDLTLALNVRGAGLTWSTLGGEFFLDFSSSRYRNYQISTGNMHIALDQTNPSDRRLSLRSNIADFTLNGAFDLEYLGSLLAFEMRNLRGAIGEKFAALDSSLAAPASTREIRAAAGRLKSSPARLDASYELVVKDLEPVSMVAGERVFNGEGVLKGSIRGDYRELAVQGEFDINSFYYGDVEAGALLENAKATFAIDRLTPEMPLRDVEMHLDFNAARAHLNSNEFDTLDLSFSYQKEYARYSARSRINQKMAASLEGQAWVTDDTVTIAADDLRWAYENFKWHADSGAALRIARQTVSLTNLIVRRDSESVALSGTIGQKGVINARLDAERVNLDDLKYVMAPREPGARHETFSGVADVHATAAGTLTEPDLAVSLRADQLAFRGIPFGTLQGTLGYRNKAIEARLEGGPEAGKGKPSLTIVGTLPFNLTPGDSGLTLPDQPMNLTVHSSGVQMSILDPLLPTFNQLAGIMRCDLTIGGTLRHPNYQGPITINECSFLFVPNNIHYTLEGNFEAQQERIKVLDAAIRNIPADERGGREGLIHLAGDLSLRDLVPGDFNLTANGQLLVVKETTRKSALSVYGNLFIEIDPAGLHFTGEIEHSLLKGGLFISNSTLVFPPTQSGVAEESPLSVPLVLVDDTTRAVEQRSMTAAARYFGITGGNGKRARYESQEESSSPSFMDGVHYDLDIETTGGNTQIQMVFNPTTNEELVAAIEGKFSITENGKQWFGDLTVDRAYYNFFKRFNAEGRIRYTGDFMNPELDITGTYKGVRALQDSLGRKNENIVVTIKITGSRLKPKIEMSMTIDGDDYYTYTRGPKSNDVESDAISFILAGSFPLTSAEKNQVAADVGTTVSSSLVTGAASPLTGVLSDFLRNQIGFINSVELNYDTQGTTVGERADIRLSGTAWNGYWRYGGKILEDPLTNANFSILYSFGTIFNNATLRNLMFELERKVETGIIGASNDYKRVNSARLFYRFSF